MTNSISRTKGWPIINERLRSVRMSASERELINIHIRDAELFVDLICSAGAKLRAAKNQAEVGYEMLAQGVRSAFKKLARS